MSFIVYFMPIKKELFDAKTIACFSRQIFNEIIKRKMYFDYSGLIRQRAYPDYFTIDFMQLCTAYDDEKSKNFIVRDLTNLLGIINLGKFFAIYKISNTIHEGCKIYNHEKSLPQESSNSSLLRNLDISDELIPEKFLCSLSKCLMDDPVYLKGKPDIKYNKPHLQYWLFQQEGLLDPFRKIPVALSDIIEDHETRNEINVFVKSIIENTLVERADKKEILRLVSEYKLPDDSSPSLEKGLRRAASEKKDHDLSIFIKKVIDVNKQDDNPMSKKAALHWATIKNSSSCVSLLVEAGADEELEDASGKSSRNYAEEAKKCEIIKIFSGVANKRRDILTLFSKTVNFPENTLNTILSYLPSPN